jgi:hypothetical protein
LGVQQKNITGRMLPSQCCGLFTVCLQKYDKAAVASAGLLWRSSNALTFAGRVAVIKLSRKRGIIDM